MTTERQIKPDDLVRIDIGMRFDAKIAPGADDAPPIDGFTEWSYCMPCGQDDAEATATMLEEIARAIREGRAFGYMQQICAEGAVERTIDDHMAEALHHN